jgi:hypothetical protein
MPEEKTSTNAETASDLSRRQFFLKLGLGSLGIAAAGTAAFAYQYLEPNVLYEPSPVVNAGKPDRYPPDSVTLDVNNAVGHQNLLGPKDRAARLDRLHRRR